MSGTTMDISPGIVGATAGPRVQEPDARWMMAYAAALGEMAPEYLDTLRPEGIRCHPLFPVCYEWPLALEIRARTLPEAVAARGVHATHDLTIHRSPRPGERLATRATVTAVEQRPPGTYVLTRFETLDARGEPVSTTEYGSLYRGVGCEGPAPAAARPQPHGGRIEGGTDAAPGAEAPRWAAPVPVPAALAHVYTECARIWNPIHTDRAVARAAGLPDIILHGTATLALALAEVLRRDAAGPATTVRRVACRFGGMVRLGSVITVEGLGVTRTAEGRAVRFRALAADGRPAVRDGLVLTAPPDRLHGGEP